MDERLRNLLSLSYGDEVFIGDASLIFTDTIIYEPDRASGNLAFAPKTIMNISIKVVAALSIVSEPFLPFSSLQLKEIINMKNNCSWNFNISKIINEGHKIGTPKHLFSRINDEEIDKVIMKMEDEKK